MKSKGYNFDEGRYLSEGEDGIASDCIEEREQINEINERIFKLHKAIKQRQIELQSDLKGEDMSYIRHLDEFESLALNIFTNNTVRLLSLIHIEPIRTGTRGSRIN